MKVLPSMIRREVGDLVYYQFSQLVRFPQLQHGICTRLGGVSKPPWSSLNVGRLVGDLPEAANENHRQIYVAAGLEPTRVVSARQVHGTNVAVVGEEQHGQVLPETDALVTNTPGTALLLRFADCVPIVLFDPMKDAISLVHSGWRGTVAGIARRAVQVMQDTFGCHPEDILAGIGPCIGPCCYEVGPDVVEEVKQAFGSTFQVVVKPGRGDRYTFDLPSAVRIQLQRAGIASVEDSGLCTSCHTTEFYSHRAEHGSTGRFAVFVSLRSELPFPDY